MTLLIIFSLCLFGGRSQYTLGLILGFHPAHERRRYKVTPSPIGWAQT